jgi:tellurite methyltransferase
MLHNIPNVMSKKYWQQFYKKKLTLEPSSFAKAVLPYVKGDMIDLGCGNYRDTNYFLFNKIDVDGIDEVYGQKVEDYIKENKSPKNVYARFFWHAIERPLQLEILKWARHNIFIEARTLQDKRKPKVFDKHERNFVYVPQLVKDLKENGFDIVKLEEGTGFSKFKGEDPYLVRVIAKKLSTSYF